MSELVREYGATGWQTGEPSGGTSADLWANIGIVGDDGDDIGTDAQWNLSAHQPFGAESRQTAVCTALTLVPNDLAVCFLQVPNDGGFPGSPPVLDGQTLTISYQIVVSNPDGTEKMVAYSDADLTITTASTILAVGTIIEQVGTDLSINGAGIIKSSAGGQFSVRVNLLGTLSS